MLCDITFAILAAHIAIWAPPSVILRWRASNAMQRCKNWRRGLRFTALEHPSRSCRGHPWCSATCLVAWFFMSLYWPRSELSTTLYMLRTTTMSTTNLSEITCCFSVHLKNQLTTLAEMVFAYSSSTSYSRGYVIVWGRTNHSNRVPPLQLYKNGNFDFTKTLVMLYTLDF